MQDYAINLGGVCLSKEYIDASTDMKWRCEKGHTWEADFEIIRQGGWCPACLKKQKDKEERLQELKAIAIKHGGKCYGEEYIGLKYKMEYECAEGHKWETTARLILKGSWCPKCSYLWRGKNQTLTLADYQKVAKEHGGECLTTEYVSCFDMFEWKCAKGHIWKTTAHNVKRGYWCKKCISQKNADMKKDVIETYHKIAAERGGKCLSEVYENSFGKLEFQCAKGHVWKTEAGIVKSGSWCPICNGRRIKKRINKNYKKRKTDDNP